MFKTRRTRDDDQHEAADLRSSLKSLGPKFAVDDMTTATRNAAAASQLASSQSKAKGKGKGQKQKKVGGLRSLGLSVKKSKGEGADKKNLMKQEKAVMAHVSQAQESLLTASHTLMVLQSPIAYATSKFSDFVKAHKIVTKCLSDEHLDSYRASGARGKSLSTDLGLMQNKLKTTMELVRCLDKNAEGHKDCGDTLFKSYRTAHECVPDITTKVVETIVCKSLHAALEARDYSLYEVLLDFKSEPKSARHGVSHLSEADALDVQWKGVTTHVNKLLAQKRDKEGSLE